MAALSLSISRVQHIALRLIQIVSRRPIFYGVLLPTASSVLSDLLVQMTSNRMADYHSKHYYYGMGQFGPSRNTNHFHNLLNLDWKRTAVFATFGFCYLGMWDYALYAIMLDRAVARLVNPNNLMMTRSVKLAFEGLVHTPLLYFPSFFFIKECFIDREHNRSPSYRLPCIDDLTACYAFWLPAQFVTFSIASCWRMPWMSAAHFIWTAILSCRCMNNA